jgi:1-acyl-sn-glycerol-3-phosphate acyltransferase
MGWVKGILASIFLTVNTVGVCAVLFPLALIRPLLTKSAQSSLNRRLDWFNRSWTRNNRVMYEGLRLSKTTVLWPEADELSLDKWYLVICNHQSWTDIVMLQSYLGGVIPAVRFFTKQQLIWVPFIGVAMWLLGFPYVRRVTKEQLRANPELRNYDRDNTLKACVGFRNHPTSVLNFVEGTRFTREKHARQNGRYKHLLNPKIGGMGYVISGMEGSLHKVVDVTITYPQGVPEFWQFLCGKCPEINISMINYDIPQEILDAPDQREQRAALSAWVEQIWLAKDARIDRQFEQN